jgi:two-component system response regulator LytT
MKILVIEDEQIVAQRLIRMIHHILGEGKGTIRHEEDIYDGLAYIREHPIDLLFLDLNLNGSDGFRVLTEAVSGSFQTIIVSAHADQAVRAFEYGVTDFVAKPFSEERLRKALERVTDPDPRLRSRLKCLAVRKGRQLRSIPVADILYLKGADDYSEIHCTDGSIHLHDKTLRDLEKRMPKSFQRLHRSYLVNTGFLAGQENEAGSRYRVILSNGEKLFLSRKKIQLVRTLLNQ